MREGEISYNPTQEHLSAVLDNIETVDTLDVSLLLTQMSSLDFLDAFKKNHKKI